MTLTAKGGARPVDAGPPGPPLSAFPPPGTVARAREVAAGILEESGLSPGDRLVADALLVTSELVTNAMRHGGGLTAFRAEVRDGAFRVLVADRNPDPPVTRVGPTVGCVGGYGWRLVHTLASHVTVTLHAAGKHITATLLPAPAPAPA
ncbi:ATP-binding protein [Streptomyces sp. NPDC101733]|uniref:ATP-binding protein n=1 Tax=unclassified Streptomyces TaxID=2593676 RepID=UPI003820F2FF